MDLNGVAMERNADRAPQLLAAIAKPERLFVLCALFEHEMNVGQLADRHKRGQSPLSRHLSKLRACGLVATRREGQQVNYTLASHEVRCVLTTL